MLPLLLATAFQYQVIDMRLAMRTANVGTKAVWIAGCPRDDSHGPRASRARCAVYRYEGRRNAYDCRYSEHRVQNALIPRELVSQDRRNNNRQYEEHLESKTSFEVVPNRHAISTLLHRHLFIDTQSAMRATSLGLPLRSPFQCGTTQRHRASRARCVAHPHDIKREVASDQSKRKQVHRHASVRVSNNHKCNGGYCTAREIELGRARFEYFPEGHESQSYPISAKVSDSANASSVHPVFSNRTY